MKAGERMHLTPYNRRILRDMNLPERVTICDNTLREGTQNLGVSFSLNDKIRIAKELDKIGLCHLSVSGTQEEISAICNLGLNVDVATLMATESARREIRREALDNAINCGIDRLELVFFITDFDIEFCYQGLSRDKVTKMAVDDVKYAKDRGIYVIACPVDISRTNSLDYGRELCGELVNAGVDAVRLDDKLGTVIPQTMKFIVREIKQTIQNRPLGIHAHNDFGLATANSLAAIEAGAEMVDVTVNGIGERTGIPALAEIATVLELVYKIETGIKLENLCQISQLIRDLTNIPIPQDKPLVGSHAFAHTIESHYREEIFYKWAAMSFDPSMVGNRRRIFLGEQSGPIAVKQKLDELNIRLPESKIEKVVEEIKEEALARRKVLTDEVIIMIARDALKIP